MPELNRPPEPQSPQPQARGRAAAVAAGLAALAFVLWALPARQGGEFRPLEGDPSLLVPTAGLPRPAPGTSLVPPQDVDYGFAPDGELTYPGLLSALQRAALTGEERKSVRRLQRDFKSNHHTAELVKEFERRAAEGKAPKPKASEFFRRLGSSPGAARAIDSFLSAPGSGAFMVRALAKPGVREALSAAAGEPRRAVASPGKGTPRFTAGDLALLKRVFPKVSAFTAAADASRAATGGLPAGPGAAGWSGERSGPEEGSDPSDTASTSLALERIREAGATRTIGGERPESPVADPGTPVPSTTTVPAPRCDYEFVICQLYKNHLHRLPDPAGAFYWTGQLAKLRASGVPENQLETRLAVPFIDGVWAQEIPKPPPAP